jgi:hypothetical protein
MIIADGRHGIDQGHEVEVMRGDGADAMSTRQGLDIGPAAQKTLAVIRAPKNFVNKEKHGMELVGLQGHQQRF